MVAWKKFGNGETPLSSKIKGDHLVGKYYVKFDKVYKFQISEMIGNGIDEKEAKSKAPILLEAQKMLIDWEKGNQQVYELWNKMNNWVYDGLNITYKNLKVSLTSYTMNLILIRLGKK